MTRIAVSGSHGTGKTTLVNRLADIYNLSVINEQAREVHSLGFVINEDVNLSVELLMLMRQMAMEENDPWHRFIVDRSLMDYIAYSEQITELSVIDSALLNSMKDMIYAYMKQRYNVIFYLPIEFELEEDDVRAQDVIYQEKIDKSLRSHYQSASIPIVTLTGNLEARVSMARSVMKAWFKI